MINLQKNIDENVCSYCGGKLEIKEIEGTNYCICMSCEIIERGVKPEIYDLAVKYLEKDNTFNYYNHLANADPKYKRMVNLSKLCYIFTFAKENM